MSNILLLTNVTKYLNHLVKFDLLRRKTFVIPFVFRVDMRRDVQEIFKMTPHEKQVLMFSATLSKDIRPVCKKFMQDVSYIIKIFS